MDEVISKLKDILTNSKQLVAFTGAGFSAESASKVLSQLI